VGQFGLSHLVQASDAIFTVESVDDFPHGDTPLFGWVDQSRRSFQGIFAGPKMVSSGPLIVSPPGRSRSRTDRRPHLGGRHQSSRVRISADCSRRLAQLEHRASVRHGGAIEGAANLIEMLPWHHLH
jgi:hypothetical protein